MQWQQPDLFAVLQVAMKSCKSRPGATKAVIHLILYGRWDKSGKSWGHSAMFRCKFPASKSVAGQMWPPQIQIVLGFERQLSWIEPCVELVFKQRKEQPAAASSCQFHCQPTHPSEGGLGRAEASLCLGLRPRGTASDKAEPRTSGDLPECFGLAATVKHHIKPSKPRCGARKVSR